jgi:SAM-dependent methyltransferase
MTRVFQTRWPFIEEFVRGKSVLDVGPAELIGSVNRHKLAHSIHQRLTESASSVVGLEQNPEQVPLLRELGFDIVEGDAEAFELERSFDVIVGGEIIEHLSNPGRFLDRVRQHLAPDGVLLLTTPNRFSARIFLAALRRNHIPIYDKPIAKHVAYYDVNCLNDMLERHRFESFDTAYYQWPGLPSGGRSVKVLNGLITRFRPSFSTGLMVAARLSS